MRGTRPDAYWEGWQEGWEEGLREGELCALRRILLKLLSQQFGDVPSDVAALVKACESPEQLETWLLRILWARTLEGVGIVPTRRLAHPDHRTPGRHRNSRQVTSTPRRPGSGWGWRRQRGDSSRGGSRR
jgi:hypothetical protein